MLQRHRALQNHISSKQLLECDWIQRKTRSCCVAFNSIISNMSKLHKVTITADDSKTTQFHLTCNKQPQKNNETHVSNIIYKSERLEFLTGNQIIGDQKGMNEWNEPHNYIVDFRLKDTVFPLFIFAKKNYLRSAKYANQSSTATERPTRTESEKGCIVCWHRTAKNCQWYTKWTKKQNMEFSCHISMWVVCS